MTAESDRMNKINRSLAWLRKTKNQRKTKRRINPQSLRVLVVKTGHLLRKLWVLSGVCDGAILGMVLLLLFGLYVMSL